jgi:hypothetical protein
MQANEFYREEMSSFWGRLAIAIMFGMCLVFVMLFFYQRSYGPIGNEPAPDWFYLMMSGFFFAFSLLVINFATLSVAASPEGVTVAYGRFRYHVTWDNIASYELEKRSALRMYGGYGIRMSLGPKGRVLVYNTWDTALVALELKQGRYKQFVFSTKRADELMSIIKTWKR